MSIHECIHLMRSIAQFYSFPKTVLTIYYLKNIFFSINKSTGIFISHSVKVFSHGIFFLIFCWWLKWHSLPKFHFIVYWIATWQQKIIPVFGIPSNFNRDSKFIIQIKHCLYNVPTFRTSKIFLKTSGLIFKKVIK